MAQTTSRSRTQDAPQRASKGSKPAPKVTVPKPARKPFYDSEALPEKYNRTHLTLVPRDPHWIYAHWEITPGTLNRIKRDIGAASEGAALTLRMHDITLKDFNGQNANSSFDIDLDPKTESWYVNLWQDNVTYCGDIGLRTKSGDFHSMTRSNVVNTPSANSSWRRDVIWMDAPSPAKRKSAFERYQELRARRPFAMIDKSGQAAKGKKFREKIWLTADDIRAYYFNLFPLLRLLRAKRLAVKNSGKRLSLSDLSRGDLEQSAVIPGLHQTAKHYKKMRTGASEELVNESGGSEQFQGASERTEKKRKFFFELWTELIVYGRTEPDATVFHGEKNIPLRQDGTFSLRFALPDEGNIPLDFKAVSRDKVEHRTITTGAFRTKTMYGP